MKQSKYYGITLIGIFFALIGFYVMKNAAEPQWLVATAPFIAVGVGCGMFGYGLGEIISQRVRNKNPELAKQIDIEEKDERNIQHANAAKAKGFVMMTYTFAALLLAYALMNVSFGILIPFVIAYLFIQFYAIYYRLKIDKEQ